MGEPARKPQCQPGAAGRQRQIQNGLGGGNEVLVARRIDDRMAAATHFEFGEPSTHGRGASLDIGAGDQADWRPALRSEHAHQIGVGHRCQRVLAHARFAEQHVADEEVTQINGALVARIGRCAGDDASAQRGLQRLGDRADVALRRRVEGGTVLEVDPFGALAAQPGERSQRLRDCLARIDRARLERDDDGVGGRQCRRLRNAVDLDHRQSLAHEIDAQIGGAGEIVCNATHQHVVHLNA